MMAMLVAGYIAKQKSPGVAPTAQQQAPTPAPAAPTRGGLGGALGGLLGGGAGPRGTRATGGIASLLAEKEFAGQFHEGEKTNVHISIVGARVILLVLFDERSSLGLVRLRVRKAAAELTQVLEVLVKKSEAGNQPSVFAEITDDDIDNLFND